MPYQDVMNVILPHQGNRSTHMTGHNADSPFKHVAEVYTQQAAQAVPGAGP
ncbi:MAG TPA: hypothetical protein VGM71_09450 [Luteibacter sp.]|jgi:hypothetical protein